MSLPPLRISVYFRRIAIAFGGIALLLTVISSVLVYLEYILVTENSKWARIALRLFDVDGEGNIPTWYSGALLLACAILAALIWASFQQSNSSGSWQWAGLAILLGVMSMDEVVGFHDGFTNPVRQLLGVTGFLYFGWVVIGWALVFVFLLFYARFFLHLPAALRKIFFLSGVLYIGGALGVETLGSNVWYMNGGPNLTYHFLVAVEELLEMWGLIVLLYGLPATLVATGREFQLIPAQDTREDFELSSDGIVSSSVDVT